MTRHWGIRTRWAWLLAAVVFALSGSAAFATYPGANGRIAFTQEFAHSRVIYSVGPGGAGLRRLTTFDYAGSPSWSADGKHLVFLRFDGSPDYSSQVFLMDADGSDRTRVTYGPRYKSSPSFAPSGRRIVYSRYGDGVHLGGLVSVRTDGTDSRVLVTGSVDEPAYSPDGQWIAFVGSPKGAGPGNGVWLIRRNGSELHHLARAKDQENEFFGLDWDPDGSQILVYRCDIDYRCQHLLIRADGSRRKEIFTRGQAFAPSGNRFVGTDGADDGIGGFVCADLITVAPSGDYRTITHNCQDYFDGGGPAVIASEPAWQPLPNG